MGEATDNAVALWKAPRSYGCAEREFVQDESAVINDFLIQRLMLLWVDARRIGCGHGDRGARGLQGSTMCRSVDANGQTW